MPDLQGTYFYTDFFSAFVRTFEFVGGVPQNQTDRTADVEDGGVSLAGVASFGEDARGELYMAKSNGQIVKLVPEE